jgi:hypothetical protein
MTQTTAIGLSLLIIAAGIGAWSQLGGIDEDNQKAAAGSTAPTTTDANAADSRPTTTDSPIQADNQQAPEPTATETPDPMQSNVEAVQNRMTEKYVNRELGFGFGHPPGYSATTFSSDPESTTLLLQHPDKRASLQIVVTQLDEPITLTADYIRQELPEYPVKNPEPVRLDGKKRGVVFASENEKFGESREIWFTRKQMLFQISSYRAFDPFVKAIFSSWTFI